MFVVGAPTIERDLLGFYPDWSARCCIKEDHVSRQAVQSPFVTHYFYYERSSRNWWEPRLGSLVSPENTLWVVVRM